MSFPPLFWCVYGFMKEALTGSSHDAILNNFWGGDRGSNFFLFNCFHLSQSDTHIEISHVKIKVWSPC